MIEPLTAQEGLAVAQLQTDLLSFAALRHTCVVERSIDGCSELGS
jgi:hypothetical protein